MKTRIYTGEIVNAALDYLNAQGHDFKWNTLYHFVQIGENVGSKVYGVYALCNLQGEVNPETERYQFSRSKRNQFWIEAVD